jgi:hypothetical protein
MCSKIKCQGKKIVLLTRRKKMLKKVYGGDNSIDSKNTDLNIRVICIHGGMEHNLAKYAKY